MSRPFSRIIAISIRGVRWRRLPRSVEEVSRLLAFCNEHVSASCPTAETPGYCGGATPDESGTQLVVSLKRLESNPRVDALNYSITAEAGCLLARRAARRG